MSIKKLFLVSLLMIKTCVLAQYRPIDTADYAQRMAFAKGIKIKNEELVKKYKTQYSGKTRSEIEKYYKEFLKEFEQNIVKDRDYTFHKGFGDKLNQILGNIRANNPEIPQNLQILIAKDNTPNAYCLSDGTFIINMGLLSWLHNEGQIASVLSHEIAHYLLEHSIKSLVKSIEGNKNTEKAEGKTAYEKSKTAFDIIKNRAYKRQEDHRKQEIQADSLGFAIFKKTDYEKSEFYHALSRLQEFDSIPPRPLKMETYKKLYTLPHQPFNENWMKKEDFNQYNYDLYKTKLNKDSLSSHPEIEQRLSALVKTFPELKTLKTSAEPSKEIKDLKHIARMEILPNLYHSENYGAGIYVAMQFLQDREEEAYNKQWLGRFFAKIYEGRKHYKLNRYLDRIEPKEQSESYQQFLSFMWNLSLAEIKNIAEHYNDEKVKN